MANKNIPSRCVLTLAFAPRVYIAAIAASFAAAGWGDLPDQLQMFWCLLGMHDIRFFADVRYVGILQLIWPITDTDADKYVYFSPNLIAEITKSLL